MIGWAGNQNYLRIEVSQVNYFLEHVDHIVILSMDITHYNYRFFQPHHIRLLLYRVIDQS